ncbi:MAG: T9SS type A sorting domain-containing protein [Bacteroidota bacterium]
MVLFTNQRGISGVKQRMNAAAFDGDGDSLSYRLIVPNQSKGVNIPGYSHPSDPRFYSNYDAGNETNDGVPTYSINPVSGEITWNAPEFQGEYAIAFKATQWRSILGIQTNIGETEVILINRIVDGLNEVSVEAPNDQCFDNISDVKAKFSINSPINENYTVQVFSDLSGALINNITTQPPEVVNFTLEGTLTLNFEIPPGLVIDPFKPYQVVITIETALETITSSWAFAIGCENWPDDIDPDPVIPEEKCEELQIYPNPVYGNTITICFPNGSDTDQPLKIVDINGKVFLDQRISQSSSNLDLQISNYPQGIYILQVGQTSKRFVVVR